MKENNNKELNLNELENVNGGMYVVAADALAKQTMPEQQAPDAESGTGF